MSVLIGLLILFVVVPYLANRVSQARNQPWAGPQTRGMRHRAVKGTSARSPGKAAAKAAKSAGTFIANPTNSQIRAQARADAHRVWQETFAADWIERQRHDRANGTGTATAAPPRRTLAQRLRLTPYPLPHEPPDNGGSNGRPANGTPARPPAEGNGGPPARPSPPPQAPPTTNGGTPVAGTSTAGAEQLIDGINKIHATAQAGGIHAKHAAVKAATEGCLRFANMLQMLARQMSEPGQHYGTEITEPIAKAATHLQAGAMTLGEADTNIATLINTTIGDVARGARQAPHHDELNESGAR